MNLDILRLNFLQHKKRIIIWTAVMFALSFLLILLYPVFESAIGSAIPPTMPIILPGIGAFYGMIVQFPILLGTCYFSYIGYSMFGSYDRDRTAEIVYTMPVKRSSILTTHIIFIFIQTVILCVAILLGNILGFLFVSQLSNVSITNLLLLIGSILVLFLIIAYLSLAISLLAKPGLSPMISVVIPIGLSIIEGIFSMFSAEDGGFAMDFFYALRYVSPFMIVGEYMTNGAFEWIPYAIFMPIVIGLLVLSYFRLNKREVV